LSLFVEVIQFPGRATGITEETAAPSIAEEKTAIRPAVTMTVPLLDSKADEFSMTRLDSHLERFFLHTCHEIDLRTAMRKGYGFSCVPLHHADKTHSIQVCHARCQKVIVFVVVVISLSLSLSLCVCVSYRDHWNFY